MRLEQDPIHTHKDVLAHTIAVVRNTRPELVVRLAALFHDVGKPKTRSFANGGVSFHHHEVVGARMTEERMRALKYPNDVVDDVVKLVYLHLRIHTYAMGWTDKAVRRYVRDAGDLLDQLNHLQRCDCTTRNQNRARALQRRMDDLERRIDELREQEELDAIRPPLDGRQVMEHLGVAPGRVVGEALDFLLEVRLDEGPISEDEAYARLDAWAARAGHRPALSEPGQAPSLRARQTMVSGTRAPGVDGRGSRMVSTRKPARPSSVNTSPTSRTWMRTDSPSRSTSIGPGSKYERVTDAAGVDAQRHRVLVREHERAVGLEHPLHLAEQARRVVDLGHRVRR